MKGCSVIFHNSRGHVLLYLRADLPAIPEPGKWNLIGGRVEPKESPEDAIRREVAEEIWIEGRPFQMTAHVPFRVYNFPDREEHVYSCPLDRPMHELTLKEGQRLQWFHQHDLASLEIGFGFMRVLTDFLALPPAAR